MVAWEAVLAAAQGYCAATQVIQMAGQHMVAAGDRIYYSCPKCGQLKYVARTFGFLTGAVCFDCQAKMLNPANWFS